MAAFSLRPSPGAQTGLLCAAVLLALASAAHAELAVGDRAPELSLQGSDGRHYTLAGLLAENEGVVLAWFPKAFTPG